MPKLNHWTDTIPILGLMTVAFLAGSLTGMKFAQVSWETLLTGVLALGAGAFALGAARVQIEHQQAEKRSEIEREESLELINFLQEMEIFNNELQNTCRAILGTNDKEQKAELLAQYYEFFFPKNMPSKPPTTGEELSFRYNQINLGYRMMSRQLNTIVHWKDAMMDETKFQESLYSNTDTLQKVSEQFPKSNLVFAVE